MNEKKLLSYTLYVSLTSYIICMCTCLFAGCQSNRVDGTILEYQRQVAILEARNTLYENTVRDCLLEIADVRARAETVEGTIDSLITEFDCYKRAVERMSQYYYETKGEVESVLDYSGSADDSADY